MLRQRVKAALPNTETNTGSCQIEETNKHGPNETTEQNTRKRTKRNGDSQPIRHRFKTLLIRMLRELTEYSNNIKEEMKFTLNEIKKNPQGTNSEGKELGIHINSLEHKKEIHIQPEQKEETRIQNKNEDGISSLWDISKSANFQIIGMPEGEEEEQEIEKLFEKILNKENFPNLVVQIQAQEAPESSKQVGPKEGHTKTHDN